MDTEQRLINMYSSYMRRPPTAADAQQSPTDKYDLEGHFIRIGHPIDSIGANRVVLDRYAGDSLRWAAESRRPLREVAKFVPLTEGSRSHGDHREAGQRQRIRAATRIDAGNDLPAGIKDRAESGPGLNQISV